MKNCQFSRPTVTSWSAVRFESQQSPAFSRDFLKFHVTSKFLPFIAKDLKNFFTKIQLLVSVLSALCPATPNYFNYVLNPTTCLCTECS